jgi:hypothetical protein
MNCSPYFSIALRRWITFAANRPAGTREALPGTICETFVPHLLRGALDAAPDYQRNSLSVRKHLLDAGHVSFIHQRQLLELSHAAGPFRTHQVALAGVPALDLPVRCELEALPGAAVRFQFQFRFRCVPWHCWKSSRQFIAPLAAAGGASPAPTKSHLRV